MITATFDKSEVPAVLAALRGTARDLRTAAAGLPHIAGRPLSEARAFAHNAAIMEAAADKLHARAVEAGVCA